MAKEKKLFDSCKSLLFFNTTCNHVAKLFQAHKIVSTQIKEENQALKDQIQHMPIYENFESAYRQNNQNATEHDVLKAFRTHLEQHNAANNASNAQPRR